MAEIAGSLYLLSTLIFAAMAAVVGVRLVALSRRTGGLPERLLGWGLQLTACWGYGVMIVTIVTQRALGLGDHPLGMACIALGWVLHNAGVLCMLRFNLVVFRPREAWARWLALAMTAVLWIGWGLYVWNGGLHTGAPSVWYWVMFATTGTYPLWGAAESFRYWRQMRRRLALGLAEPMLVDRFRIWGIASASAAAAIWAVNAPFLMGLTIGSPEAAEVTAISRLVTAGFGLVTIGAYWLTFFPPAFYRQRVASRSAPGA